MTEGFVQSGRRWIGDERVADVHTNGTRTTGEDGEEWEEGRRKIMIESANCFKQRCVIWESMNKKEVMV